MVDVASYSHVQSACKGLEYSFYLMMLVCTACLNVKIHVCSVAQTLEEVKGLIGLLPQGQRDVVLMRFYQDLSFKEIADITGVSINTALGRMRYALLNLRRMIKEKNIVLN